MIPEPQPSDALVSLEQHYKRYDPPYQNTEGLLTRCIIRRCHAAESQLAAAARDWSDDHTHLQTLCRTAGVPEQQVMGDSNGVPGIGDLADMLAAQLADLRAEVERLRAGIARPVSKEGRAMNRRKGRMVRASELKKEIDGIMEKFGDTCFYITGLAWASVALWQQADVDELEAALLAKEPTI